jgi:DNA gyrase/topoisomerase IV subunit A
MMNMKEKQEVIKTLEKENDKLAYQIEK